MGCLGEKETANTIQAGVGGGGGAAGRPKASALHCQSACGPVADGCNVIALGSESSGYIFPSPVLLQRKSQHVVLFTEKI